MHSLSDSIKPSDAIKQSIQLLTLPQVYLKVKQVVEDEHASLNDLAKCIVYDPALTAQLLRMANCALWAPNHKIETVSRALDVLGMRHVHDLVLATCVASTFKSINTPYISLEKFWKKSVFTAIASSELGELCELIDVQRPFVEGLLSDIGHMILYNAYPEKALRAYELSEGNMATLVHYEDEFMGCNYAEVGAMLAEHWQLPVCFSKVIGLQNTPENAGVYSLEASIIHVASRLAYQVFENPQLDMIEAIHAEAWQTLGQTEACLEALSAKAKENMSSVIQMVM